MTETSNANYYQRTISKPIHCTGIGLHSGKVIDLWFRQAPPDHGIRFVRTDDFQDIEISARVENVVETTLATTLGCKKARIGTVEHLLAACSGMGIDNLLVEVSGPEIPILDGSAAPFVFLLKEAGVHIQKTMKRFLVIRKPITVRGGGKWVSIKPSDCFRISYRIDFDHPLMFDQSLEMVFSSGEFQKNIARARTFGFLNDVEALKARGLAQGGSLDNAIVVDNFRVLNSDGLRFEDEFVRHKILDVMGDLALFGMPVIGQLTAYRSGHELNNRLIRKVLDNREAYQVIVPSEEARIQEYAITLPVWSGAFERIN